MLKIKDDVDLKELEKFGFKFNDGIYEFEIDKTNSWCLDENKKRQHTKELQKLIICGNDGRALGYLVECKINFNILGYGYSIWNFDLIFDLTQAGLVEKVGGEDEQTN